MLNRILSYLDIQVRPYRSLVASFILTDLRGQHYANATGAKPGEVIPPLFWVVCQYLFISLIISTILYARVSVWAYALVGITTSVFLIISALIVEFNEVVLSYDDLMIIGFMPISKRTYAAARLTNLVFYLVLLTIAVTIFPAILGVGLRDSNIWYLPAYIFCSFMATLFVSAIIIVIYSYTSHQRSTNNYREVLAWTQIVLAVVVFYGAQLMLRDNTHQIEVFLAEPPAWIRYLPSAWFADFIKLAVGRRSYTLLATWTASIMILAGSASLYAMSKLVHFYSDVQPVVHQLSAQRNESVATSWILTLIRRFIKNSQYASLICFNCKIFLRDHDLKMRTFPTLSVIGAMIGMGLLTNQLGNPLSGNPKAAILSIAIGQMMIMAVPALLHNMRFSRDYHASWLLQIAPVTVRYYAQSTGYFISWGIMFPMLLILWLGSSILWGNALHATIHWGFVWLQAILVCNISLRGLRLKAPFSEPTTRGSIMGSIAPFLASVSFLSMLTGALYYYLIAYRHWYLLIVYAFLLIAAWSITKLLVRGRHYAKKSTV